MTKPTLASCVDHSASHQSDMPNSRRAPLCCVSNQKCPSKQDAHMPSHQRPKPPKTCPVGYARSLVYGCISRIFLSRLSLTCPPVTHQPTSYQSFENGTHVRPCLPDLCLMLTPTWCSSSSLLTGRPSLNTTCLPVSIWTKTPHTPTSPLLVYCTVSSPTPPNPPSSSPTSHAPKPLTPHQAHHLHHAPSSTTHAHVPCLRVDDLSSPSPPPSPPLSSRGLPAHCPAAAAAPVPGQGGPQGAAARVHRCLSQQDHVGPGGPPGGVQGAQHAVGGCRRVCVPPGAALPAGCVQGCGPRLQDPPAIPD